MIIKKDYFRNLDNTDLITSQTFILKSISHNNTLYHTENNYPNEHKPHT